MSQNVFDSSWAQKSKDSQWFDKGLSDILELLTVKRVLGYPLNLGNAFIQVQPLSTNFLGVIPIDTYSIYGIK